MKSVGWALFFCLMIFGQVFVVITLAEKKSRDERLAVLEEQTLKMNNEAAALNLESEKLRNHYYNVLQHSDMFPSAEYGKEE
jgi:hypothetical protein